MKNLNLMIVLVLSLMLIISTAGISQAIVQGPCSNCHTMHNMQNGTIPVGGSATPNDFLTLNTCLGCHGETGTTVPGAPNVFGEPGSTMTAGGTFNATYVDTNSDDYTKVHNVIDIAWTNEEGPFADTDPPGATAGSLGENIRAAGSAVPNFSCAGTYGCHGDHSAGNVTSDQGIKGFHHDPNAGYRYCRTDNGTKILGKGSTDWEAGGADATNHNVYNADTTAGISAFCAECHGDFHGEANTRSSSPFIRHPTNNLLSAASGWTLGNVTVDYNNNPFSFQGTDYDSVTNDAAYTTTGARVACVSCHRAHGTSNSDILRFTYEGQIAGGGNTIGCLGCHERQR